MGCLGVDGGGCQRWAEGVNGATVRRWSQLGKVGMGLRDALSFDQFHAVRPVVSGRWLVRGGYGWERLRSRHNGYGLSAFVRAAVRGGLRQVVGLDAPVFDGILEKMPMF
ncbi:hypothetical protein CASFOL_031715 [Castilleja foliolosa]|uniref:Uncharacterized protein n=1 Tax=Castilleja foliolosa TaxID=1961234 RepID=A0ABD3C651_9LAMI